MSQPAAAFAAMDVRAIRAGIAERARQRSPGPELAVVRDLPAGGVPAGLYRPGAEPLPPVVYLHGGGWSIGDLASFDRMSRRLADAAGAAVLTLDYRLANFMLMDEVSPACRAAADRVAADLRRLLARP